MGILAVTFISGVQIAFVALAFAAGVAIVGLAAFCVFWFLGGIAEAILKKINERQRAAKIAELENRIAERRREQQ
jgi:CHASE3 domain sensor protein